MQNVGTVEKGKQRIAGLKLEQEELNRKIAREYADQHKRMGRLCESAGLFEVVAADEALRKGFAELAARFRNQGSATPSAGVAAGDAAAATVSRAKGKVRDVPVTPEG